MNIQPCCMACLIGQIEKAFRLIKPEIRADLLNVPLHSLILSSQSTVISRVNQKGLED